MPDAITQTPEGWKLPTINETATSSITSTTSTYPRHGRVSSKMEDGMWSDCWKVIEKYAGWEALRKTQSQGADAHEGEGVQDGQATMHGPTEGDDIMNIPPTPGSGRSAYNEPEPQWKEPNILDEYMEGIHMAGNVEMGNVDTIAASRVEESATKRTEPNKELTSGRHTTEPKEASPVPGGTEVSRSIPSDMVSVVYGTATSGCDAAKSAVNQSAFDTGLATITAQATEPDVPVHSLANFSNQLKEVSGDPPLPQMTDDLALETLHARSAPEAAPSGSTISSQGTPHVNSSPDFLYTIQSSCATDTDITPTTRIALDVWQGRGWTASSSIEQTEHNLGFHQSQVELKAGTENVIVEIGKVKAESAIETESAQLKGYQYQTDSNAREHLVNDLSEPDDGVKPVTGVRGSHSPKVVVSPARMPIKFPDSFHRRVLDETVAQGLDYEEQVLIMEAVRGVERTASLSEVAEGTGAVEVDPAELVAPSPIQPIPPSAPSPEMPARGRKRKGKTDGAAQDASKKPKPASQIKAYTNEEHLARGWTFQDRKRFEAMKGTEVREYIRSILAAKRWWNGLPKANMITKIMDWQQEMLNLQAEQPGDDSEATMAADDPEANTEKTLSRQASLSSQIVKPTSRSSTAAAVPETPANQPNNQSFVRTSSSAAQSDVKLFFDPDAAPRQTPLLQKLKGAKEDVADGAQQTSDSDAMDTAPSSPLEIKTRSKSAMSDTDSGKRGTASRSSTPQKEEFHEKSAKPGEGNDRRRSLRSRTASVAPESYA